MEMRYEEGKSEITTAQSVEWIDEGQMNYYIIEIENNLNKNRNAFITYNNCLLHDVRCCCWVESYIFLVPWIRINFICSHFRFLNWISESKITILVDYLFHVRALFLLKQMSSTEWMQSFSIFFKPTFSWDCFAFYQNDAMKWYQHLFHLPCILLWCSSSKMHKGYLKLDLHYIPDEPLELISLKTSKYPHLINRNSNALVQIGSHISIVT